VSNLILLFTIIFQFFFENFKIKEMLINSDFLKENSEFNNL